MIPFGMMTATTDHGGTVMATQQQVIANGMAFLRAGDGFVCPKCKVWSTLIMSNQNIIMFGKPVAFAGDKFTCGATLMPSQSLVGGDKQGGGSGQTQRSNAAQNNSDQHNQHFQLVDEHNEPLHDMTVMLTKPDGTQQETKTDGSGKTPILSGRATDSIILDLFKDH